MKDLKQMGEITLKVFHVDNIRQSEQTEMAQNEIDGVGVVPEKALKGRSLSHKSRQAIHTVLPTDD